MGTKKEIVSLDKLTENGIFKASGNVFNLKPIFLREMTEYLEDCPILPPLQNANGEDYSEKEITQTLISLFSVQRETVDKDKQDEKSVFYGTSGYGYAKWLEKKVEINCEPIKFTDLEEKYNLTKVDIARLIVKLAEFSGF